MANSRRGTALTVLAILFAILAVSDILKPLHLEGPTTGLVFFGKRLSGAPNAILGPILGIVLLIYAAGIWRMSRYALYLGYAYAIYVTINLMLFSARNPLASFPERDDFRHRLYRFRAGAQLGDTGTAQPPPRRTRVGRPWSFGRYRRERRLCGLRLRLASAPTAMTTTPTDPKVSHHGRKFPRSRINAVSRKAAPIARAPIQIKVA